MNDINTWPANYRKHIYLSASISRVSLMSASFTVTSKPGTFGTFVRLPCSTSISSFKKFTKSLSAVNHKERNGEIMHMTCKYLNWISYLFIQYQDYSGKLNTCAPAPYLGTRTVCNSRVVQHFAVNPVRKCINYCKSLILRKILQKRWENWHKTCQETERLLDHDHY